MERTLAGKRFNITPQDVEKKMQGVEPETLWTHVVKIGKSLYPVKQVISIVTGLSKADFTSHQARQILRRLGFEVVAREVETGSKR